MLVTSEVKKEVFKKFGGSETNSGGPESQVALFTKRIDHLTEHLKTHKKDHGTEKALLQLVGRRKQLLNYLRTHHLDRYRAVIQELGLRK
jgi:small subunit ribosomal protein S15